MVLGGICIALRGRIYGEAHKAHKLVLRRKLVLVSLADAGQMCATINPARQGARLLHTASQHSSQPNVKAFRAFDASFHRLSHLARYIIASPRPRPHLAQHAVLHSVYSRTLGVSIRSKTASIAATRREFTQLVHDRWVQQIRVFAQTEPAFESVFVIVTGEPVECGSGHCLQTEDAVHSACASTHNDVSQRFCQYWEVRDWLALEFRFLL